MTVCQYNLESSMLYFTRMSLVTPYKSNIFVSLVTCGLHVYQHDKLNAYDIDVERHCFYVTLL